MPTQYRTIVADPPWEYGAWGKATPAIRPNSKVRPIPYSTMTLAEIEALPVGDFAADDCDLYLWVTNRYLPAAFDVIGAWGFSYCQTLTWCKRPRGTGQGGLYCPTTEFLILARRGAMPKGKTRVDSTWWQVKRPHNAHSKKPAFFYSLIESVSDGPRLEMFARPITPMFPKVAGWDTWGNEMENDAELLNGMSSGITTMEQPSPASQPNSELFR